MKSATLPVLAALAAALAGTMLVSPKAEARRSPSAGFSSIGLKSGPGSIALGQKAPPVIRDHRGTAGKLHCQGPYCPPPKKAIIDSVKGTTTGTASKECLTYEGPWCRQPHRPHGH